ncbi:MAG: hypothetical protein ACR2KC_00015 [Acidimicrobiales bacterium]
MPQLLLTMLTASNASRGPALHPDAGGLPGSATTQRLADGVGGWALIAAMLGIVVGAVLCGPSATIRRTISRLRTDVVA